MKKAKVLHVVSNLNRGGAETMIMNIYRNIDYDKISFDFLCLSNVNGDYENEIKSIGGKIFKIYNKNILKKTYNIYKLLKKENYTAVHSHVMFFSGYIQLISFLARIKKRITHSHSSSDSKKISITRKLYMSFSRCLINVFTNIKVSCGEDAGKYLYGKKHKYKILKNGIDISKYINVTNEEVKGLKKELNIKNDDFIIGHVGSFQKLKNQDFFIELANELKKSETKFKIILVGAGERYQYIYNSVLENNLQDYIIMPGLRSDIHKFMKMFDVFVMPSLYEGFPLVVVEALSGDNICFLSSNIPKETNIINSRVFFFDLDIKKDKLIEQIFEKHTNKKNVDLEGILTEKGFSVKKLASEVSNIYTEDVINK